MKIIGYARVSTTHQQLDSQIIALQNYGCTQIYLEQEGGCKEHCPQLEKAISVLEPGDTFVIYKLDRLYKGTKQLLSLMEYFEANKINFVSLQNNIDTSTSMGEFFFTVMNAFAEMESELIKERVKSGIEEAKAKGVTLGRPAVNKNMDKVIAQYLNTQDPVTKIATDNNISRPTVYRYLKLKDIPLRKID